MKQFDIQWRSDEGYGDFITGVGYAHSSTIKYQRPVAITFHWPNPKNTLLSSIDKEPINYRFDVILEYFKPVEGLTIKHEYNSSPNYRFINELEEFNPLHGLWYPKNKLSVESGLVVFWSSKHNLKFPGYPKDPLYDHWDNIVLDLTRLGYQVVEVTYRTPIREAMELMCRCEFGIGYEGMIHQLFKFLWKPIIIASKRVSLATLLAPQGVIITDYREIAGKDIQHFVNISKRRIELLLAQHKQYLDDKQDPEQHHFYNKPLT